MSSPTLVTRLCRRRGVASFVTQVTTSEFGEVQVADGTTNANADSCRSVFGVRGPVLRMRTYIAIALGPRLSLRPRLSRLRQCRPLGAVPGRDWLVMGMAGVERRVSDGRRYVELFFLPEFRTWYDYPEEQIWNLVIGLSRFIYLQLVVRWQQGQPWAEISPPSSWSSFSVSFVLRVVYLYGTRSGRRTVSRDSVPRV